MKNTVALSIVLFLISSSSNADVKPAALFSDHMVLQRGQDIPVWGAASPSEQVSVTLAGQTQRAAASSNGKWRVTFTPITAPADQPLEMRIESTDGEVTFRYVPRFFVVGCFLFLSAIALLVWLARRGKAAAS